MSETVEKMSVEAIRRRLKMRMAEEEDRTKAKNRAHQAEYRRRRRRREDELEGEVSRLNDEVKRLHAKIAEDDGLRREVGKLIQRINDLT